MLRQAVVVLVVIASVLFVAGTIIGAEGTPTVTPTNESNESTHTLVITTNGSGSYTVSASDSLHLEENQPTYTLPEGGIRDTVGQQGNQKDVINYTGRIESFQAEGPVQVSIDGQQIPPEVLGGQHLQIIRNNSDQPIRYQIPITGQASPGESVEQEDTATNGQIDGQVRDQSDAFYFTGDISEDSLSISENATVLINGQNASVFLSNPPPTPPETATQPSPSTATETPPPSSTSTQSLATNTPTNSGETAGSSGINLLDQVVRTVVVLGLLALIGMGAVLYLRQ